MSVVASERRTAFVAPIQNVQVRDSGDPNTAYTVTGHAAVFDSLSLDLGGFREKIDPGAFANALGRSPDVLAVIDHDTRWTLGRTLNGTLELSEDDKGLRFFLRVAPTSYAADLRILLERGDISQCSFMFTIAEERYEVIGEDDREIVVFTIEEVGELYDVTICGRGAYPQTDVSLVRKARTDLAENLLASRAAALAGEDNPDAEAAEADGSEGVAETGTTERQSSKPGAVERARAAMKGVRKQ